MRKILQSECLKQKHGAYFKLCLVLPFISLFIAFLLCGPTILESFSIYWWEALFLFTLAGLLFVYDYKAEEGAGHFQNTLQGKLTGKIKVAKVEAHLKREERLKQAKKDFQEFKREFSTMTFYLQEKSIYINGERVPLTSREYHILELLSSQPKKVFTRENIYESVYNNDSDTLFRSISEYVYQIRQKFSSYDINPIKTVRGVGYQWHD